MIIRLLPVVFFSGLLLNISGYFIAGFIKGYYKFPLFLDSTGTILCGVILGPIAGGIAGLATNFILGIIHNPVNIPFGIVNMLIGITAGLIAKKYGFMSLKSLVLAIIFLVPISALSGAIIAFYLFGGVTGAKIDLNVISIMDAGYQIFTGSFLVRIPVNLMDKSLSAVIVFLIIRFLPSQYRGDASAK
jgi:energy-coupling factor transport system substrate-specific component